MMKRWISLLCLALIAMTAHLRAESPPVMIQLTQPHKENGEIYSGIQFYIQDGWHMYAPVPDGVSLFQGFEPKLDTRKSQNLEKIIPHWPVSVYGTVGGYDTYTYEGNVTVPIGVTPLNPNQNVTLTLDINLLACSTMCVPVNVQLNQQIDPKTLPEGDAVARALEAQENALEGVPLLWILFLAFIGGVILNVMPCVLPVLSLKLISLTKKHSLSSLKKSFAITTLGILSSFLVLACLTLIAREMGDAVGWGMHFQNPYFLNIMFIITLVFGLSLLGLFHIQLSSGATEWLAQHEGRGAWRDFFTGAFATLLATPCTAPFLGSAIGFALARNDLDIILIFFSIGLGFSLPYILGLLLPTQWIRLPKPGPWMVIAERIMGMALLLTALWIASLLLSHLTYQEILLILFFIGVAAGLYKSRNHSRIRRLSIALALTIAALIPILHDRVDAPSQETLDHIWQPFEPEKIPDLVNDGKTVVVDITADWCVTCAVNKAMVLDQAEIIQELEQPTTVAMRGDWTRKDPKISSFLKSYQRFGIPFNMVFGPSDPDGVVLNEILTVRDVKQAIKKSRN